MISKVRCVRVSDGTLSKEMDRVEAIRNFGVYHESGLDSDVSWSGWAYIDGGADTPVPMGPFGSEEEALVKSVEEANDRERLRHDAPMFRFETVK